jgi:hypothetical protein
VTFDNNIYFNNVLQYELYRAYTQNSTINDKNWTYALPMLAKIHGNREPIQVICDPTPSFPLLSVQAIIVYKNYRLQGNPWSFFYMQRSDEVAAFPGFLQIPPSGGFECSGSSKNSSYEDVKRGFHIENAIYRELMEELFDEKNELQDDISWQNENNFKKNAQKMQIIEIEKMICQDDAAQKNKGCGIHFLGVVVSLVALRHHLSFLIIVDNEKFAHENIYARMESQYISSERIVNLDNIMLKQSHITPDSIGLTLLLKKSGLLEKYNILPEEETNREL